MAPRMLRAERIENFKLGPWAITITNDSERAVEVYSVDFDTQYVEEENMLR